MDQRLSHMETGYGSGEEEEVSMRHEPVRNHALVERQAGPLSRVIFPMLFGTITLVFVFAAMRRDGGKRNEWVQDVVDVITNPSPSNPPTQPPADGVRGETTWITVGMVLTVLMVLVNLMAYFIVSGVTTGVFGTVDLVLNAFRSGLRAGAPIVDSIVSLFLGVFHMGFLAGYSAITYFSNLVKVAVFVVIGYSLYVGLRKLYDGYITGPEEKMLLIQVVGLAVLAAVMAMSNEDMTTKAKAVVAIALVTAYVYITDAEVTHLTGFILVVAAVAIFVGLMCRSLWTVLQVGVALLLFSVLRYAATDISRTDSAANTPPPSPPIPTPKPKPRPPVVLCFPGDDDPRC